MPTSAHHPSLHTQYNNGHLHNRAPPVSKDQMSQGETDAHKHNTKQQQYTHGIDTKV